jgi:hypothetical protein
MPPAGMEPTILAGERTQTRDLDRAATGTGIATVLSDVISVWSSALVRI